MRHASSIPSVLLSLSSFVLCWSGQWEAPAALVHTARIYILFYAVAALILSSGILAVYALRLDNRPKPPFGSIGPPPWWHELLRFGAAVLLLLNVDDPLAVLLAGALIVNWMAIIAEHRNGKGSPECPFPEDR